MGNLSFTVKLNCPDKYCGENRYLTDWEKKMRKAIEKIVDKELKEKKERQNPPQEGTRRRVIVMDIDLLDEKKWYEKRIGEYEEVYRREYTLKNLEKSGLEIEEFLKTWMGSCDGRTNMLLGCVQDKIDGFDYDEDGARIPNHKKMDLYDMVAKYDNDTLRINDGVHKYTFELDEHQLIYINGERVFPMVNPVITKKEFDEQMKAFSESMRADRLRHEQAMQKSMEAAKDFWVKD